MTSSASLWNPDNDFDLAVAALRRGDLVGMPTETVYGLAGNALDAEVVASIFQAKARPSFDPLIVHCANVEDALDRAGDVPDEARVLAERFWPGPLTLVLPKGKGMPDLLSSGLPTVAFRVPSHPFARRLIEACGFPLAAPSANRFGRISPTRPEHVLEELGDQARLAGVLDGGACERGLESTVVAFPEQGPRVLRLGSLPLEALQDILPEIQFERVLVDEEDPKLAARGEQSPGMLSRHYAPNTRLRLLDEDEDPGELAPRTGTLSLGEPLRRGVHSEILSANGDLVEAAAGLFAALRRLDASGLDRIVAWRLPEAGLGRAINDRLERAAK